MREFSDILWEARHLFAIVALAFLVVAGCDTGPQTALVRGKVSYQGAPIPKGTIRFFPANGGRPAIGQIQPDGSYELARTKPGDGVELGDYEVAIEATEALNAPPFAASLLDEINTPPSRPSSQVKIKHLVPENYSNQKSSGLTATVTKGKNQIDFNLP